MERLRFAVELSEFSATLVFRLYLSAGDPRETHQASTTYLLELIVLNCTICGLTLQISAIPFLDPPWIQLGPI